MSAILTLTVHLHNTAVREDMNEMYVAPLVLANHVPLVATAQRVNLVVILMTNVP